MTIEPGEPASPNPLVNAYGGYAKGLLFLALLQHQGRHGRPQAEGRAATARMGAAVNHRSYLTSLHLPYFATARSSKPKPSPGVWCRMIRPLLC
jgi:hypothetical protein